MQAGRPALHAVRTQVDELVEQGLVSRWSIKEVLDAVLSHLTGELSLRGAFVETYGEDLELHVFSRGSVEDTVAFVADATSAERRERVTVRGETTIVAQPIDVAGTWFGRAAFVAGANADAEGLAELLDTTCEVLDNYLFALRSMRERHLLTMRLGNALRHPLLGEGLARAVAVLAEAISIGRMVIVYRAEERAGSALHVQAFRGDRVELDTLGRDDDDHADLRRLGGAYLAGQGKGLLEALDLRDAQEEVLINGITKSVIVGKIVVTSTRGAFNTFDRELLGAFAGFIRQRIVDFNKEWRSLARSFCPDDVSRLLATEDYERRYLAPRDEEVGILYVDISGFTRISETILKAPARVAELVEAWSHETVNIVWRHGGVFDKMVGDCVIALFGPPFYEEETGARLASALRCAADVRAMTQRLPEREAFAGLRAGGLDVSVGVNLAPLFVGRFGPDGNFTGFSSGMNNTARLQGCARPGEIAVMEEAIGRLPPSSAFTFGEPRTAAVKNVAEPLAFRPLLST